MKQPSYRDRDYAFGQVMLTLRSAIGLTQIALADHLSVSRRAVGEWESGSKYPNAEHLKQFITLALQHGAFPAGREADEIRALWKMARQKVLLDEAWLATLVPAVAPIELRQGRAVSSPARSIERNPAVLEWRYGFPFQPTTFIGRGDELAEIARILRDPACRLLTLTGPGGVGKTRLALEAAAGHTDTYADGVAFVSLASVGAPKQIASAIGDVLHLSFGNESDPTKHLLASLRERHMLLVLDNFEHLLEGAALVFNILERSPRVTILVTSRERLNLRAEWQFDVQGLSYPPEDASGALARYNVVTVSDYSAVQLFVQRVAQVQRGFTVSDAALRTIVNICQYVVGMPLAIELAAAGVRVMPLAEIERHISSNLNMLATTLRDVPARHRSLRAVFDHSWDLISEQEQAPFTRLAVFRGGFTAEAASRVAGASRAALLTLVDKSLLRQSSAPVRASVDHSAPRFLLLEPIREYALEKLKERQEAVALRRDHTLYYLELAQAAAAQWETPTAEAALEELDRELDNMRAALQWAVSDGEPLIGLQLAEALVRYWRSRVYLDEARQWLEALLALTENETGLAALALRMRTTYATAMIFADRREYSHAGLLFEQSRALRHALGAGGDEITMLINQAQQARTVGDYQRATALLEESLALYRAAGDLGTFTSGGYGFVLYFLAHMLREQGDFTRATALYLECRQFHIGVGDREGATQGFLGLSDIARDLGDSAELRRYGSESLATYREFGTQWAIGFSLNNLALAAYYEGDLAEAFALISESVSMFRVQKAEGSLAEVLVTLGAVLLAQGDLDGAYEALIESLRLAWGTAPRLLIAAALEGLGCVLVPRGQAPMAVTALAAAALLRLGMGAPLRPADRPVYDRAMAAARSKLGANDFGALWAEAQSMPLEQVIELVAGGGVQFNRQGN